MHVYHYAAYEISAICRLMGRYASREEEVDALLRNNVFVDLYTVVRQGMLVGASSYSLKKIEHLYLSGRGAEVATAGDSIVYYFRWLSARDGEDWLTSAILRMIRDYNKEDCDSTWKLIEWLRARQAEAGIMYVEPEPPNELAESTTARAALARDMLQRVPLDASADSEYWRVFSLLAHLLEFHRREQKSQYRERFERRAMTDSELIDDAECLGSVERTSTAPLSVKRSFEYEYTFPEQETKLSAGSDCEIVGIEPIAVTIHSFNLDNRLLTIKRQAPLPHRFNLIPNDIVRPEPIISNIERLVRVFADSGRLPSALNDFLFRRRPRINGSLSGPLLQPGEDTLRGMKRVALNMDRTTLCIQGPPGSGKTTKCAQVIAALLRAGKRVGISSNSHAVICHLMKSAVEAAVKEQTFFTAAKFGGDTEPFHPKIQMFAGNGDLSALAEWPSLVGGTAWVFSREDSAGKLDYLFVDEAGQVCVAHLVGMASSARNLILMGDQMQLSQPVQGVHPGESGLSILDYYLEERNTIPADLGIFLPTSWRMRPEICSFISSAFYENRLKHESLTQGRYIQVTRNTRLLRETSGLVFVPVEHNDRVYECPEEAEAIKEIVGDLIGQTFEQAGKPSRSLNEEDILIVAPYNLQRRLLRAALPNVRIGTVDKFQGQEAPVVIFSMTASEGDAAPRGIEFLFDKHRLNVAISRAQVLAIIVASPRLAVTRCSNIKQMELVNTFCRFVEIGSRPATSTASSPLVA